MSAIFPAVEVVSTEEGEGRAGLVVSAGDALHLQLEVQLQWFTSCQVSQRRVSLERGRQEVVGLRALILQQAVCAHAFSDQVTSLLLLQGAQQRGLMKKRRRLQQLKEVFVYILCITGRIYFSHTPELRPTLASPPLPPPGRWYPQRGSLSCRN